ADKLLQEAGASYEKASEAQKDSAEQAERLWLAGNRYLDGHDAKRAAAALDRFRVIAEQSANDQRFKARLTEANYKLGLARRDIGEFKAAETAFPAAASHTLWKSRYVYRARYELAEILKQNNDGEWPDAAQASLEQNHTQLRLAMEDRDEEAREK